MALDFPANPTQGQQAVLSNGITYQWDGAKWNTRLVPSYANTGGNPGVTPPDNPSPGTFWWDSENDNSTSGMWMQTPLSGCKAAVARYSIR